MKEYKVPIQCLIDHIKTAHDVDPWAKDMAEELLERDKPVHAELEGGGSTWWYVCEECHTAIDTGAHFCGQCGRPILWEGLKEKSVPRGGTDGKPYLF